MIKKSIALAAISFAAASPLTAQLHPLDMIFNEFPTGPVQTDSYWTRDVELMDLNGDGHLDLFAANLDQAFRAYELDFERLDAFRENRANRGFSSHVPAPA